LASQSKGGESKTDEPSIPPQRRALVSIEIIQLCRKSGLVEVVEAISTISDADGEQEVGDFSGWESVDDALKSMEMPW
jgi:hypothetical protein